MLSFLGKQLAATPWGSVWKEPEHKHVDCTHVSNISSRSQRDKKRSFVSNIRYGTFFGLINGLYKIRIRKKFLLSKNVRFQKTMSILKLDQARSLLYKNHGKVRWWVKKMGCIWIWIIHTSRAKMQGILYCTGKESRIRSRYCSKRFGGSPELGTGMYPERGQTPLWLYCVLLLKTNRPTCHPWKWWRIPINMMNGKGW